MASQWEQIKWIPGTRLMVDGFRYQNPACKSYLLTHFHSDHTTGLTRSFTAGVVFCTPITARLLRKDMGLPSERICEVPLNKPVEIEGTEVTAICANHCPGACMFLFKVKGSAERKAQTILHTGDMRWDDAMAQHPALRTQVIDLLFMDTTYAKPNHTHPPQDQCIATMADLMQREVAKNPRTLFVCGSYHIGKERAYLGVAKLLGWKVWCEAHKSRVLKMLDLPADQMACLASKPQDAKIHVDFLGGLQPERLKKKLEGSPWTHAVGFRPTGWTFRRSGKLDKREEGNVKIYGIPYSEHSSWTELRSCVALLRPRRLVPTVNASNAAAARSIVNRFADLMDLSEDRSRLDFFLQRRHQLASLQLPRRSASLENLLPGTPDFLQDIKEEAIELSRQESMTNEQASEAAEDIIDDDSEDEVHCSLEQLSGAATVSQSAGDMTGCSDRSQAGGLLQPSMISGARLCTAIRPESSTAVPSLVTEALTAAGRDLDPAGSALLSRGDQASSSACLIGTDCQMGQPRQEQQHQGVGGCSSEEIREGSVVTLSAQRQLLENAEAGVQRYEEEAVCNTPRADSKESCTEHEELGLMQVDVAEQLRILQSINEARKRHQRQVAEGLARKRQATLGSFFSR